MADLDFLSFFISEPIYVINEKNDNETVPIQSQVNDAYMPGGSVLVLFAGQVTDALPLAEMTLLTKILEAVKCPLDDVDIRPNSLEIPLTKYKKVISFTTDYAFSNEVKYQLYFEGQAQILISDSLAKLEQSPALKKPLWEKLQEMFR